MLDFQNKTFVCGLCSGDDFLRDFVEEQGSSGQCSYCGDDGIVTPLTELVNFMRSRIEAHFTDAANAPIPFESREGGYQFPTQTTIELLETIGFTPKRASLRDDVAGQLPDHAWVHRNPLSLTEEEGLQFGWEEFCRLVKHETRYLFFPRRREIWPVDANEITPENMLGRLGELIGDYGLITELEVGTRLFRVRIHKENENPASFSELGPPPTAAARFSNRMSPAGISMFYAAFDEHTALAETPVKGTGCVMYTVAVFVLTSRVRVLNLVDIPESPSFFDETSDIDMPAIGFLHDFRWDMTQPIEKDGREHTEYVPSQIVTEYFRYKYGQDNDDSIEGIIYPSSRSDGVSCVLFLSYDDCNSTFRMERDCPITLSSFDRKSIDPR